MNNTRMIQNITDPLINHFEQGTPLFRFPTYQITTMCNSHCFVPPVNPIGDISFNFNLFDPYVVAHIINQNLILFYQHQQLFYWMFIEAAWFLRECFWFQNSRSPHQCDINKCKLVRQRYDKKLFVICNMQIIEWIQKVWEMLSIVYWFVSCQVENL